jgi:hypothetical protein
MMRYLIFGASLPGLTRQSIFFERLLFRRWMDARPGMTAEGKSARSAKAALRDWQDTIAAAHLCNPAEACHIAVCRSIS